MLRVGSFYQLNMWKFGLNHNKSFAHVRGLGEILHVVYLNPDLPENLGFDILIKRINYGKSIEAEIVDVGKEFKIDKKERKRFVGQRLSIQAY